MKSGSDKRNRRCGRSGLVVKEHKGLRDRNRIGERRAGAAPVVENLAPAAISISALVWQAGVQPGQSGDLGRCDDPLQPFVFDGERGDWVAHGGDGERQSVYQLSPSAREQQAFETSRDRRRRICGGGILGVREWDDGPSEFRTL
jgi:hypothetical protein